MNMCDFERRALSCSSTEQIICGRKRELGPKARARTTWSDCGSKARTPMFSALDIATAIQKPLLPDDILLKAVAPALRGAQRTRGTVPIEALAEALECALTSGASTELQIVLHQFAIDHVIFAPDIVHANPDEAAILCAALAVDPWNTICQAAACQVGNFNQVCPYLSI
jgi:hypothetical protein